MRRVAFSMSVDPDGAMHNWVDVPEGWVLTRVPTQEAVHLLGIRGYQQVLIDLCRTERPDLLVTHPPYDYLTPSSADLIRAAGTRILGYAFDDAIFAPRYGVQTRAALERIYDRYVTTLEVPWATAPLPAVERRAPEFDVALVGQAYSRRIALVEELRSAGFRVVARGHGWPEGMVSRREMISVYSRSAVILTTGDWEDLHVPMVKHRLLDTAMLGLFQIAQESDDLRNYFPEEEVPSYRDIGELVIRVREALSDPDECGKRAGAARKRALENHTWKNRFPTLVGPLAFGEESRESENRSLLFTHLLLSLATRAESDGRIGAAASLYEEILSRDRREPAAAAGLGRCLRELGDTEGALPWLRLAADAESPTCASALNVSIPSFGVGTGLGKLALFPPSAEPLILLVASLLELGRIGEACELMDSVIDPVIARALASTLVLGDEPSLDPVRERLRSMGAPPEGEE